MGVGVGENGIAFDAEQAAGAVTPLDPALAADGVDWSVDVLDDPGGTDDWHSTTEEGIERFVAGTLYAGPGRKIPSTFIAESSFSHPL